MSRRVLVGNRRPVSPWTVALLFGAISVQSVSCTPNNLGQLDDTAPRDELVMQWTFVPAGGRQFSSAQAINECQFVFADRETGELSIAALGAQMSTRTVKRLGAPSLRGGQVDVEATGRISLSFPSESSFANLAVSDSTYQALTTPPHPWGGRLSGNAVFAPNGFVIAADFGSTAIQRPEAAPQAPLVAILRPDGAYHSKQEPPIQSVVTFQPTMHV